MRTTFLTTLIVTFAALTSACASHVQSPQGYNASTTQTNTNERVQTENYFSMEPARLEKGHIFLRPAAEDEDKPLSKTNIFMRRTALDEDRPISKSHIFMRRTALDEEQTTPIEKPGIKPEKMHSKATASSVSPPPEATTKAEQDVQQAQTETIREPEQPDKLEQMQQPDAEKENLAHRRQKAPLGKPPARENRLSALPPHKWQEIRDARVNVHVQNSPFKKMIEDIIERIEPRVGPWEVQWKLTRENRDLLKERFSLNTETTFNKFINNVASYILNLRGIELNFELFETKRVLIVSDVF